MREIRTSGLRRGQEVGGHWPMCLSIRDFPPYSTANLISVLLKVRIVHFVEFGAVDEGLNRFPVRPLRWMRSACERTAGEGNQRPETR